MCGSLHVSAVVCGVRSPGELELHSCELPDVSTGNLTQVPLSEQRALLSSEPSLQLRTLLSA